MASKLVVGMKDVSPDYFYDPRSAAFSREILKYEGTPKAIKYFAENHKNLNSYSYWFFLSTLWVSYNGWSDLALWKELFSATRKNRETSIMKPSELRVLHSAPERVIAYRAHREGEADWISYTTDINKACEFAGRRECSKISEYEIVRSDIVALFLRRGEQEIIVLDKSKALLIRNIPVVIDLTLPTAYEIRPMK